MDSTTEGSVAASRPVAPSSSGDQWPRLATGPVREVARPPSTGPTPCGQRRESPGT